MSISICRAVSAPPQRQPIRCNDGTATVRSRTWLLGANDSLCALPTLASSRRRAKNAAGLVARRLLQLGPRRRVGRRVACAVRHRRRATADSNDRAWRDECGRGAGTVGSVAVKPRVHVQLLCVRGELCL